MRERERASARGGCEPPALPLPDKPSIAVLPFANMSGDPEQEYFADGMVEEIITALSPHPLAVRHRPQFELHLQGPSRRREAGRPRARRPLCARRLGAQSRRPGAHHRAADRRAHRRASLGRPLRRLAGRRVRSSGQGGDQRRRRHRAGIAGGRDRAARPSGRRTISPPTISICARLRIFLSDEGASSSRRSTCSSRRSRAIRITGLHSAWAAICHCGSYDRRLGRRSRQTSPRQAIDLARQALERRRTTRASSPMPPSCWPISARISAP